MYAAGYASLAAAGQGTDATARRQGAGPPVGQALGWPRADLPRWQKQAASGKAEARAAAQQSLRHWQQDPDRAGVREKAALTVLPADERAEWGKSWAEVTDMVQRWSSLGWEVVATPPSAGREA